MENLGENDNWLKFTEIWYLGANLHPFSWGFPPLLSRGGPLFHLCPLGGLKTLSDLFSLSWVSPPESSGSTFVDSSLAGLPGGSGGGGLLFLFFDEVSHSSWI